MAEGSNRSPVKVEDVSFSAEDGWPLKGTLFCPQARSKAAANTTTPRGVLVSSATGEILFCPWTPNH